MKTKKNAGLVYAALGTQVKWDFFHESSSMTIKTVSTYKNICTKIAQSNMFSCFLSSNHCKHFSGICRQIYYL